MNAKQGHNSFGRRVATMQFRPSAIALALVMALALTDCGGGGGGNGGGSGSSATSGFYFNVATANTVIKSASYQGASGLTKDGGGKLVLTGASTYTGGTTINAGTLKLGNGGTTGSITGDVLDNGILAFDHSNDWVFYGTISGSGSLQKLGSGKLTLQGDNTYSGGTFIGSGTLQLGVGSTYGWIVGNVQDNGALVFDRSDDHIFNGLISGSGSVEQAGTGSVILTADNTYTGGTTISGGGTLQLGNGGTTGWITGDVNVLSYGTLVFDRSDNITFSGAISGYGSVTQAGSGTLTLAGTNAFTGDTTVLHGTVIIPTGGSLAGGAMVDSGGSLIIQSGATVHGGVGVQAGGTLDNSGSIITTYGGAVGSGGTVLNHAGGLIEGPSGSSYSNMPAITGVSINNEAGSTIEGGIGVDTTGTLINDGGTIKGLDQDAIDDAAKVENINGGSILAGTTGSISSVIAIGIKTSSTGAVVDNLGASTIQGVLGGIRMQDGGTVTNDGNSVISGKTAVLITSQSSATATVNNTGGSTITGSYAGIDMDYGGTVINGAGSTIEATNTPSTDCSVTLACSIYVSSTILGGNGSDGTLTLTNAGSIIGNVQLDTRVPNYITLVAGGSIQGDLRTGTNAQSTLTLDGATGTTQSYSSAVTGTTIFAGSIIKQGGGTWIIDSSDLQGVTGTTVNDGVLQSTQLLAGTVSVNAPGTLDAVPGVVGDLSNAGTVAVHGGTTTVGGNYTQSSAGTLAVNLGSTLNVTGTATLNGGTLEITGADSGYVSNTHTNVLTATGGVTGTFSNLVKDSGVVFTSTTIQYDANSVWLDTTGLNITTAAAYGPVQYTPVSMSSAQRIQGAFEQLNTKIANRDLTGISGNFLIAAGQFQQAPTVQAAQASLTSLSGQLHAASTAIISHAIDTSNDVLSDRFYNLIDHGAGFGMWTHSYNLGGDLARAGFDSVGYRLNGRMVGGDRQIGSSGVAGYAFGESRGQQRLDQSVNHDDSHSTEGMLYAGWINGNRYVLGRVGLGNYSMGVSRQLLLGYSVQGVDTQYNGSYQAAYGESGQRFNLGRTHVVPFVNAEYEHIARNGFSENGAGGFGLRSGAHALNRWQAGFGVRADRQWNLDGGRSVDLSAKAQWKRTLATQGDVYNASLVGMQHWQPLVGIGLSRYQGLLDVGLATKLSNHTNLKFNYDYEMGQRDRAQMVSARLVVPL